MRDHEGREVAVDGQLTQRTQDRFAAAVQGTGRFVKEEQDGLFIRPRAMVTRVPLTTGELVVALVGLHSEPDRVEQITRLVPSSTQVGAVHVGDDQQLVDRDQGASRFDLWEMIPIRSRRPLAVDVCDGARM